MSLYAIADLHLSLGTDKPMDVFSGWSDYVPRLKKNWESLVTDDDTVVIAGDISWAMKLEECSEDFSFINALPGKKIFLKGNHDYWWQTKTKIDDYLLRNGFDTISILFNNAFLIDGAAVCGTRGWYYDKDGEHDEKIINREIGRLRLSYNAARTLADNAAHALNDNAAHALTDDPGNAARTPAAAPLNTADPSERSPVVFLHYPPVYGDVECREMMDALLELGVKECYYGHLHGERTHRNAVTGMYKGINFHLISCDYTRFFPILVR